MKISDAIAGLDIPDVEDDLLVSKAIVVLEYVDEAGQVFHGVHKNDVSHWDSVGMLQCALWNLRDSWEAKNVS